MRRSRGRHAAILAFAAINLIAAAFIKLASEVAEGETRRIDDAVLLAFRHPDNLAQPIGPKWVQTAFTDLTSLGSVTVLALVTVLVVGFLWSERKRRPAIFIGLAVASGAILSTTLKLFINRARPETVAHLVQVSTSSFPSGHAMLSAVTYLTLGALLYREIEMRRTRLLVATSAVLLTGLVGLSRIYLGVHYPTDVVGGWCAGAAWAALCLSAEAFFDAKAAH